MIEVDYQNLITYIKQGNYSHDHEIINRVNTYFQLSGHDINIEKVLDIISELDSEIKKISHERYGYLRYIGCII